MDGEDFSNDDTPVLPERVQTESSVDFGDDFGVVQFADDDNSTPIDSFSGIRTEQIPQVVATPVVQAPKLIQISEDSISPTPARGDVRERVNLTGGSRRIEPKNAPPPVPRSTREGRITIGSDLTGEQNRPTLVPNNRQRNSSTGTARRDTTGGIARTQPQQVRRARVNSQSDSVTGPRRRTRANSPEQSQSADKRDIPTATAVGALLAAIYIGATLFGPVAVVSLLVVVLGLASVEFFSQTSITGYQPATIVGVLACIACPLTAYWVGDAALPLVFAFAFIAAAVSFIGTTSVESDPAANLGLTMLGIIWIGLFGSYGALILRISNTGVGFESVGTDTLFIVVIGVMANDVMAFFIGMALGRTPLRAWISPAKTMEGFVGGAIGTFAVVIAAGMQSGTWTKLSHWLIIATVISIAGPIGDLTESMIKRSMNIKDFGTLLRGHGGALDRFDSILFTLPIIYYLTLVLTPWVV
jgi:CDP-diglyceride synthetase